MATNFPTSVDNFTNPTANDSLNLPSHSTQHANANDAIEAVEDYLLNGAGKAGLVLLKTQTIGSAVSSVVVTNAFNATYENYKILISGGAGSGSASLHLKLGSTATGYKWGIGYIAYATGNPTSYSSSTSGTSFLDCAAMSTASITCNIDLHSPFASKQTMMITQYAYTDVGSVWGGGTQQSTTSFTDFTFTTGSGTMTGGTIYVYGYRTA